MPLQQVTNSARLRNKENTSQADPQSSYQNSPIKQSLQNGFVKNSPYKKSLSTQITQLKIRLSDRQFQLKKLEEDCSVKLAMMQKQLIKEKNQKKLIMKQCKQKLEQDKQYFETKISLLEQQWKNKEKEIYQRTKNQTLQTSQKELINQKQKFQADLQQKNQEVQKLKKQFQNEKQLLINNHKIQLQKAEILKQSSIQQIIQKNQQDINQIRQQHLSQIQFYHQMENEKVKENNVVVKILSEKIRTAEEELRNIKSKLIQLNKQLQKKEEELVFERRAKQEYRLDKIYLERKLARLEPDIKDQFEKQLQACKLSYRSSLQQLKKLSMQQLSDLKIQHQQSTLNYQNQLSQMQERCRQVSFIHQTIKSNEDDLKKIEILQMKLIKKQMELQKQRQDVKMCKLELSNMDQIFHKMFEEAKLKSLRPKRHRLPSLLSVGQNRSTMDVYNNHMTEQVKEKKKFSIREINHQFMNKSKETRELSSEFAPYQ